MDLISRYFNHLADTQITQLSSLPEIYTQKNKYVNLISRKDIQHIELHHILHSLSIARHFKFAAGTQILDLGTGGGFPGIPLAILFPESQFTLIDGTKKKIQIVKEVIEEIGLSNVVALPERAEEHRGKYDFIVSRAVAKLDKLWHWSTPLLLRKNTEAGLIALKGGNIQEEINELPKSTTSKIIFIHSFFQYDYFTEKFIVFIQRRKRR